MLKVRPVTLQTASFSIIGSHVNLEESYRKNVVNAIMNLTLFD